MRTLIPALSLLMLALTFVSAVVTVYGWNRPEQVLPAFMHPTTELARLIYASLTGWLFGGTVVFFYLRLAFGF